MVIINCCLDARFYDFRISCLRAISVNKTGEIYYTVMNDAIASELNLVNEKLTFKAIKRGDFNAQNAF